MFSAELLLYFPSKERTQSLRHYLNSSVFNQAQEIVLLKQCKHLIFLIYLSHTTHKVICELIQTLLRVLWISTYSDSVLQIQRAVIPAKKGQSEKLRIKYTGPLSIAACWWCVFNVLLVVIKVNLTKACL